jgi:hypothetical protein
MKKIKILSIFFLSLVLFTSCEEEVEALGTNYITFASDSYSTGVDVGATASVDVTVYSANITGSDRSFNINVDGSAAAANSYTVPATVTIPGGTNEGSMTVQLSDTNLGIGVNSIVLSFAGEEGLYADSTSSVNYVQNCNEVSASLDIVFDGYGSETSWVIYDSLGGVVVSKSAGSYADGQATASETFQLCEGRSYTFVMEDSYGDGLSFPANGSYTLTVGGSVKATGGGNFGSEDSTDFDTN